MRQLFCRFSIGAVTCHRVLLLMLLLFFPKTWILIQFAFPCYISSIFQEKRYTFTVGVRGGVLYDTVYKNWRRLIQMPTHRYPHQCYKMLRSLDETGKTKWASHVRTIRITHTFGYVWAANTIGDANRFKSIYTKRMKDIRYKIGEAG